MFYRAMYEKRSVLQTKQRRESVMVHFECNEKEPPHDKVVALIKKVSKNDFVEKSITVRKVKSAEGFRVYKL